MSVRPERPEKPVKTNPFRGMPAWGWVFVALCVLIPVVSLGGALPGALGGGGAFGCASVARDETKPQGTRLALCVGITVVCWALFLGLAIAMAGMRR